VAGSKPKNDNSLERVRIMVNSELSNFNREHRIATIQRYLIILYLANIHPLFRDGGIPVGNLRYFAGPKLIEVARAIAKEWGVWIKFDRSRTAERKYKLCQSNGYVHVKPEPGNIKRFALTEEGFKHCEELIDSFYRKVSSRNLSKVRIFALNSYSKNTSFLALKEDGSYVLGTADIDLKKKGITENSLIEYDKNELDDNFGKLPFKCRIEHISNNSLRILDEDDSIPRTKDITNTDIKDIKVEDELYYIRGEIVSRWSPDDKEGIRELEDEQTREVTIQDNTGKISYIKVPYDSDWREETIRIGTPVEVIGIFKSRLRIRDDTTLKTSLYAPYRVEFFRPFRYHPQQRSRGPKDTRGAEHPISPSIESISSKDPCVSIPAVKRLCRQKTVEFENFVDILKHDEYLGIVNQYVLQTLCKAFPKQSAPILLKMILEANDDWCAAVNAANCFGPHHREFAEAKLVRILEEAEFDCDCDVARVCIEGLGNICVDRTRYDLIGPLVVRIRGTPFRYRPKSSDYDKYYNFVCKALARIFLCDIRKYESAWYNSSHLQDMMKVAIDHEDGRTVYPSVEDITKEIFAQCTSVHADVLVEEWLLSEEMIFRKIGAYALGMARISRVVPHLIKILDNEAEHIEVMDEVSRALGSIGGTDAVEALLQHRRIGAIGYALGELNDFELYDHSLQKYLQSLKYSNDEVYRETNLLVYRAIGLKKDKRYVDMLRELLYDSRPSFRGVAALALARINGPEEAATLTKTYEESGSPMESIMTGLGLLLIRSPESDDILGHLQNDLTIDSQTDEPYLSDWRFRADVVSILRNTHKPLATQIANSWEMVYHRRGN
jgi:hypothetical protein